MQMHRQLPRNLSLQRAVLAVIPLALAAACSDLSVPTAPAASPTAARASRAPGAIPDSMVATPAGLRPRACVHEVPSGAHVSANGLVHRKDGSTFQLPWCTRPAPAAGGQKPGAETLAPTLNGWISSARYHPGQNWQSISANWNTPAAPSGSYSCGQVWYTFPGLQSSAFINQPVLQYGCNNSFGGNYYTAASWHCDSGPNCVFSTPISVSPGDAMHGSVSASSCSGGNCTWTITTTDNTTSTSTTYTVVDTQAYADAVGGAVETYGLTSCSQLPTFGVYYTDVLLYNYSVRVNPAWSNSVTSGLTPSCGFAVSSSTFNVNLTNSSPAPAPAPTITSVTTSPSPAKQYIPNTLTINGSGFDPSTVMVEARGTSGSCTDTQPCKLTSFSTKTSTQLVLTFQLSITGTYTIYVRNGLAGAWGGGQSITVVPL